MPRFDLFKSTAFRLAMLFSGLFLISFIAAGALAYSFIQGGLAERLDRSVRDTIDIIVHSYGEGDIEDLTAIVGRYAAISHDNASVYLLTDPSGKRLAGNVAIADVPDALADVDSARFGLDNNQRYRALKRVLHGNTLVVGLSYSDTEELGNTALSSFSWAGGLACLVAIFAGIGLARTVSLRLQAIGSTMALVGQGDLTARISRRGGGDDVDVLAERVNAALDRLSALVDSMRQVSVDIAHDLKTPLNRLAMTIETAMEKAEFGVDNTIDLLQAQDEGKRLNATFEALLRIAQLEAGARRERFVNVSISSVLEVLVEAYAEVALENGQTLIYAPTADTSAMVHGDRDLLTQLFANLIENAIRHSGPGSIGIALTGNPDRVIVTISDEGPGIPLQERQRVFQRLYRLEKSRTTPGTGLGLSLVKAISDLHGAEISLRDGSPGLDVVIGFRRVKG
jgi:signal transduction histidine kinase